MLRKLFAIEFVAFGALIAAGVPIEPAMAAALSEAAMNVPCSGVWKLNEDLTRRTRSPAGPFYQFFEPWGKEGWMRMNTGLLDAAINGAEWHFEQFDGRAYQVFGGDPSLQHSRKIADRIVATIRVREGKEADYSLVVFSKDCKRITYYFPEGDDRHGAPGKTHYYNDIRVFDAIEPPDAAAALLAPEMFGGWMLDREASKLTLSPENAETVVIVPWGKSGWIWSQLAGGPYQPEDLMKGVKRVECGAASGATAIACKGSPSHMLLYWATWDSSTFPSYGSEPGQVQAKRINDRNVEVTLLKPRGSNTPPAKSTVMLSPDGRRLTVATRSAADGATEDLRVYDRIDAANWPAVSP